MSGVVSGGCSVGVLEGAVLYLELSACIVGSK